MAGKGDKTRPRQVSKDHFDNEFDRIFYGKQEDKEENQSQDEKDKE